MADKTDLEIVDCFTPDNGDGSTLIIYKFSDGCEIRIDRGLEGVGITKNGESVLFSIEDWDSNPEIIFSQHRKAMALYNEKLYKENVMENQFEWKDLKNLDTTNYGLRDYKGEFLKTDFNIYDTYYNGVKIVDDNQCFLVISHSPNDTSMWFFRNQDDIDNFNPKLSYEFDGNVDIAKKIVEKTVEQFSNNNDVKIDKIESYINKEFSIMVLNRPEQPSVSDHQLETAQKTGYVQGVCESVLAFNTDENRKIMSEATVSFLSKKMLSEMNVTKDMAQKFANPETYKALEKCLFAPAQEQQLEQTQTQGRGR